MWKKLHRTLLAAALFSLLATPSEAQEVLTLRRAIEIGLQNNYSILIGENNAAIAENNNNIGNSGFLPFVNQKETQNTSITNT